jgi:hypothetical protein
VIGGLKNNTENGRMKKWKDGKRSWQLAVSGKL